MAVSAGKVGLRSFLAKAADVGVPLRGWVRVALAATLLLVAAVATLIVLDPRPVGRPFEQALRNSLFAARHLGVLPPELRIERTVQLTEWSANVLMFFPIAFAIAGIVGMRLRRWVVPLLILGSCSIEAVQWLFLPGRFGSASDILANSLGAIIGYRLLVAVTRRGARRARNVQPLRSVPARTPALSGRHRA
jgi:VanZ family protein